MGQFDLFSDQLNNSSNNFGFFTELIR